MRVSVRKRHEGGRTRAMMTCIAHEPSSPGMNPVEVAWPGNWCRPGAHPRSRCENGLAQRDASESASIAWFSTKGERVRRFVSLGWVMMMMVMITMLKARPLPPPSTPLIQARTPRFAGSVMIPQPSNADDSAHQALLAVWQILLVQTHLPRSASVGFGM